MSSEEPLRRLFTRLHLARYGKNGFHAVRGGSIDERPFFRSKLS
jgi:hypothetical protein